MKLFWEQQQKNIPRSARGRRYHPTIICLCISVAAKSASAYDELRDTFKDSIVLPSRRVLRDSSNAITPKTGLIQVWLVKLRMQQKTTPVAKDMLWSFLMK